MQTPINAGLNIPDSLFIIGEGQSSLTRHAIETAILRGVKNITVFADNFENDLPAPVAVMPRSEVDDQEAGHCFVALGDISERERTISKLSRFKLVNLVHPSACVSLSATLAENIYIGPQAIVGASATIATGVIQNALSSIEHDNSIGAYSFLGTGAILCGNVTLGDKAFIGGSAVVKPGLSVGSNTVLGTGAVLVSDAQANAVYVGNPARAKSN